MLTRINRIVYQITRQTCSIFYNNCIRGGFIVLSISPDSTSFGVAIL